ncbi:MAG: type II toxin-antitoxin system VapC family toxin [Chroococcidiopsidaceae cyanobacterium CP_BM_RX_35]|nr:type II toxin-antitoxin system VapC family toxin [Chroococcidiopsidaceae cyanobacterium CP_BM_RX_35]
MTRALCLDTSVLIQYLVPEEFQAQAEALVLEAVEAAVQLIAPAFAWAEIGSVLRKKTRAGLISTEQAKGCFDDFCQLPIDYINTDKIRTRAWQIAEQYQMSTLYDAAFLACAESVGANCQFWTADKTLLNQLGPDRPNYVRELGRL